MEFCRGEVIMRILCIILRDFFCANSCFHQIDVDKESLVDRRQSHVRHLIYPCNTVLDDGIGCALWFAGRGEGMLFSGEAYTSPARVSAANDFRVLCLFSF